MRFAGSFGAALLALLCSWMPMAMGASSEDDLTNFSQVSTNLYRGAQPTPVGIEKLHSIGVKTIINLRMPDDLLGKEESAAKNAGIAYTNIPMASIGRPSLETMDHILSVIETASAPVFVHCQFGQDRTGTVIACYRIKHDKWTAAAALKEAKEHGMASWETGMHEFVKDFAQKAK